MSTTPFQPEVLTQVAQTCDFIEIGETLDLDEILGYVPSYQCGRPSQWLETSKQAVSHADTPIHVAPAQCFEETGNGCVEQLRSHFHTGVFFLTLILYSVLTISVIHS
jgi:hypothetical protein